MICGAIYVGRVWSHHFMYQWIILFLSREKCSTGPLLPPDRWEVEWVDWDELERIGSGTQCCNRNKKKQRQEWLCTMNLGQTACLWIWIWISIYVIWTTPPLLSHEATAFLYCTSISPSINISFFFLKNSQLWIITVMVLE